LNLAASLTAGMFGALGWTLAARRADVGVAAGPVLSSTAWLAPLPAPYDVVGKRQGYGEEIGGFGRAIGPLLDAGQRRDRARCRPLPNGTGAHGQRVSPASVEIAPSRFATTAGPGRPGGWMLNSLMSDLLDLLRQLKCITVDARITTAFYFAISRIAQYPEAHN